MPVPAATVTKTCDNGGKPQGPVREHPERESPLVPRRLDPPASSAAHITISTPPYPGVLGNDSLSVPQEPGSSPHKGLSIPSHQDVTVSQPPVPSAELIALQAQLAAMQAVVDRQQREIAAAAAVPQNKATETTDDQLLAKLMKQQGQSQASIQQQLRAQQLQQSQAEEVARSAAAAAATSELARRDEEIAALRKQMLLMSDQPRKQDPQVIDLQAKLSRADAQYGVDIAARDEQFRRVEDALKGLQCQRAQDLEKQDPLVAQLHHFCEVVRGERTPIVDAVEGARSLAAALAVLESAATNRPVRLEEYSPAVR